MPCPTEELTAAWPGPPPSGSSRSRPSCGGGCPSIALAEVTGIDPWFLSEIAAITDARMALDLQVTLGVTVDDLDRRAWRRLKRLGFSDQQLAYLFGDTGHRRRHPGGPSPVGVGVTYKTVDTCGAEFEAHTPYHYSTTEDEDEIRPSERERVVILGSGPNRIGQGIEFDYCCVHASLALRTAGYETVMVNCNPETVSTDYDTSDRLYFEPLTPEDVANVIDAEIRASVGEGRLVGVIVSLGGQTPLKLAAGLPEELVLGTSPSSIDLAEDRRALERAVPPPGHPPTSRWHGDDGRRGGRGGVLDRLPGAGPSLLRARGQGHGDRLRRRAVG